MNLLHSRLLCPIVEVFSILFNVLSAVDGSVWCHLHHHLAVAGLKIVPGGRKSRHVYVVCDGVKIEPISVLARWTIGPVVYMFNVFLFGYPNIKEVVEGCQNRRRLIGWYVRHCHITFVFYFIVLRTFIISNNGM